MNANVRSLSFETGAALVDGAGVLAEASPDGVLGFEMLYDYVHFTPEGAERLGAALAGAILGKKDEETAPLVEKRRALLASRAKDALEVWEYLGWNADRALLADRDLWKYEKASEALGKKAEENTASPEELVWAANGLALAVGGEARARDLYARAKAASPELAPVIEANLRWLDSR
ncbi:hypothetical protein HY251_16490 [bacterium]|nr:hypothetical protein [bacterium]